MITLNIDQLEVVAGGKSVAQRNREKRNEVMRRQAEARKAEKKSTASEKVSKVVSRAESELCKDLPKGTKVSGSVKVGTSEYGFESECP